MKITRTVALGLVFLSSTFATPFPVADPMHPPEALQPVWKNSASHYDENRDLVHTEDFTTNRLNGTIKLYILKFFIGDEMPMNIKLPQAQPKPEPTPATESTSTPESTTETTESISAPESTSTPAPTPWHSATITTKTEPPWTYAWKKPDWGLKPGEYPVCGANAPIKCAKRHEATKESCMQLLEVLDGHSKDIELWDQKYAYQAICWKDHNGTGDQCCASVSETVYAVGENLAVGVRAAMEACMDEDSGLVSAKVEHVQLGKYCVNQCLSNRYWCP